MRVHDLVRECIGFIGIIDDKGLFAPYGTVFFVDWEDNGSHFLYVVTARHVIEDIFKTKRQSALRVNDRNGKAKLLSLDNAKWTYHDNDGVDVAVTIFPGSTEHFKYIGVPIQRHALTEGYIKKNHIGPGDEVFTIGLLVRHFGTEANIPVVRTGNIAMMPEDEIEIGERGKHRVYLVESRSIGGLSGSPVFLSTSTHRILRNGDIIQNVGHALQYIIGINIGLFRTSANRDNIQEEKMEAIDFSLRRELVLEVISSGIAVVVPIERATEVIKGTALTNFRSAVSQVPPA